MQTLLEMKRLENDSDLFTNYVNQPVQEEVTRYDHCYFIPLLAVIIMIFLTIYKTILIFHTIQALRLSLGYEEFLQMSSVILN